MWEVERSGGKCSIKSLGIAWFAQEKFYLLMKQLNR